MRGTRFLLLLVPLIAAHESCCAKKLSYIADPDDEPPSDFMGEPRFVSAEEPAPDDWNEEEDGPWESALELNPNYTWRPRFVPNPAFAPPTLSARVADELTKAAPWVVLGVAISALLSTVLQPSRDLSAWLRRAGPLEGALAGLATPLCSCGSLPVAAALAADGVPLRATTAFLVATQSAGLDSVAISWGLLGPTAALARLAGAMAIAVAAGAAVGGQPGGGARRGRTVAKSGGRAQDKKVALKTAPKQMHGTPAPPRDGWCALALAVCRSAVDAAADTFPTVGLGVVLSAAALHQLPWLAEAYQSFATGGGTLAAAAPLLTRVAAPLSC